MTNSRISNWIKYLSFFVLTYPAHSNLASGDIDKSISVANSLLSYGISSFAEEILSPFKLHPKAFSAKFHISLIDSLISRNKLGEAENTFKRIRKAELNSRAHLRIAIVKWRKNAQASHLPLQFNTLQVQSNLMRCKAKDLNQHEKSWFYFLNSIISLPVSPFLTTTNLKKAKEVCVGKNLFEEIHYHEKLIGNKLLSNQTLEKFKEKIRKTNEIEKRISFIETYAQILFQRGQEKEALDELDVEIRFLRKKGKHKPLKLLKGRLLNRLGKNADKEFKSILSQKDESKKILKEAFFEWKNGKAFNENLDSKLRWLKFITKEKNHPLKDELLLLKAELLIGQREFKKAETFLQTKLNNKEINHPKALIFLAMLSYQKGEQGYFLAAEKLQQVQTQFPDLQQSIIKLRAELYFLNKNYELSSKLYKSLLDFVLCQFSKPQILFAYVTSLLKQERIEEAKKSLDEALAKNWCKNDEWRWKTTWNLIQWQLEKNDLSGAYEYLKASIIAVKPPSPFLEEYLLCKANLELDLNLIEEALVTIAELIALNLNEELQNKALLIRAKCFSLTNKPEEAEAILQLLQETNVGLEASLELAKLHQKTNNHLKAKQIYIEIADKFTSSKRAPMALYQAATICSQMGIDQKKKSVQLLENLIERYPNSEWSFFAHLKQGDLLRSLNEFELAQKVYRQIINNYPKHPHIPFCELAEAKCFLAKENSKHLKNLILPLKLNLSKESVSIELRAETAYILGLVLEKLEKFSEAKSIYWSPVTYFIVEDKPNNILSKTSLYWISRCIMSFAELSRKTSELSDAKKAYEIIKKHHLPGLKIAEERLKQL